MTVWPVRQQCHAVRAGGASSACPAGDMLATAAQATPHPHAAWTCCKRPSKAKHSPPRKRAHGAGVREEVFGEQRACQAHVGNLAGAVARQQDCRRWGRGRWGGVVISTATNKWLWLKGKIGAAAAAKPHKHASPTELQALGASAHRWNFSCRGALSCGHAAGQGQQVMHSRGQRQRLRHLGASASSMLQHKECITLKPAVACASFTTPCHAHCNHSVPGSAGRGQCQWPPSCHEHSSRIPCGPDDRAT